MKFTIVVFLMGMSVLSFGQEKRKVACVGNRITQGFGHTHAGSYPSQLGKILGDAYEVRNFGVGGRTLLTKADYPYVNEKEYKESQAYAPDIVIILLGTNDSKDRNWIYGDEFANDYYALIRVYQSLPSNPTIYLGLALPVFKPLDTISETVVKNEINPEVNEIAEAHQLGIIDFYSPFLDKSDLIPDGVHPNKKGYRLMATIAASEIGKE
jgi:lysophospholipase L1-like esterase